MRENLSPTVEVREFRPDARVDKLYPIVETRKKAAQIQEQSLSDLYGKDAVQRDREYVTARKREFDQLNTPAEKENAKAAAIFEGLICEQMQAQDWMGEGLVEENKGELSQVFIASEYDDLKNGVDCIFKPGETVDPGGITAFSIDATFSHNEKALKKKHWDLQSLADGKELARIKYFDLGDSFSFRGELKNVPRFIIGYQRDSVLRAANEVYALGKQDSFAAEKVGRAVLAQLTMESLAMGMMANALWNKTKKEDPNSLQLDTVRTVWQKEARAYNFFLKALKRKAQAKELSMKDFVSAAKTDTVSADIIDYYKSALMENLQKWGRENLNLPRGPLSQEFFQAM